MQVRSYPYELPTGKPMAGKALALRVKKTAPAQRAVLAARIARGEVSITRPTTAQVATLLGLHVGSVSLAKSASDEDLASLRCGRLSLRALRAKRQWFRVSDVTDAGVADLIARAGIERVRSVLDAMTAPAQAAE